MRRALLAMLFAAGFACAGGLSAAVVAGTLPATTGTTSAPPPTGSTTVPTATTGTTDTKPKPPPRPVVLPQRVTIGRVPVGGLSPGAAYAAVRSAVVEPLAVSFEGVTFRPSPTRFRVVAAIRQAVQRARFARPGARLPLRVALAEPRVRTYVAVLARRLDRKPVDSELLLRGGKPWISPGRAGRVLERSRAQAAIVRALKTVPRVRVRLFARRVPPAVTRRSFGPVIVIKRGSKRLSLFDGMRFRRSFGVATGQASYPTPLGRFSIVVKWQNPWWYPPASPWAQGLSPVPPGPGNPLGTRWMGLTAPGVGIHGTPDAASIGYSASHGCIRMRIAEAEWLFERVAIGTPVLIIAA